MRQLTRQRLGKKLPSEGPTIGTPFVEGERVATPARSDLQSRRDLGSVT